MDVEKVIRDYLPDVIHMLLGTCAGNKPWVCEVHFVYDNDLNLYWRSLTSRRHSREIDSNPKVAGNIVRQHTLDDYPHGIYFEGRAEKIDVEAERNKAFPLFQKRLNCDEGILEEAKREDGHQFYKVNVDSWYAFGKFGGYKGQKFELKWGK
ncbi:pyridoxamine 5'-phosphate oxidase family protein [Candidatus Saccharibacteria bacterium]|nr:pyridoxamine 5'-phosphate oxidase family protein [Candidatus Saccharibacteria bacterium]